MTQAQPAMALPDENELIASCRRGDAAAWNSLFDLHYAAAARFVAKLGPELALEDVEEICQETFLTVIRCLDQFQGGCRLQTWVFRIAANKLHDHRERQHAAKRGGGQVPLSLQAENDDGSPLVDPPSSRPGPAEALVSAERSAIVVRALAALNPPCREVIELRYFADLSYEEISGLLRLNVKTVSSRLSKCLDRFEGIVRPLLNGEKLPVSPSN